MKCLDLKKKKKKKLLLYIYYNYNNKFSWYIKKNMNCFYGLKKVICIKSNPELKMNHLIKKKILLIT